jgi:hypothetical protein
MMPKFVQENDVRILDRVWMDPPLAASESPEEF